MHAFSTREAHAGDLPAVLQVQRQAFGRVARMFDIDPAQLPPLTESLEDLSALIAQTTRFFVACDEEGSIVGSVRGTLADGTVEIGRLVVDEGWLRQGVGTALMELLESSYPEAVRFELFTGSEADVPLALYARRGYRVYRREQAAGVLLVWLEKPGPSAL